MPVRLHTLTLVCLFFALPGCGRDKESGNDLHAAAEQSDPASAAILEDAARTGSDPQAALEKAGNASVSQPNTSSDGVSLQARPNLPDSPNRKDGTQAPDKVAVPAS